MHDSDVGVGDAWRAGVLLRQVHQRKHREIDAALTPFGLSMSQYVVLLAVAELPEASAHAVAVRTAQTDQSVGATLRTLVETGLVDRADGMGRLYRHRLSSRGKALVQRCEEPVRAKLKEVFAPLSEAEVAQLRSLLERL
ncbi:MarR family winged helix-turn-helix transcriptional regulator [Streptomyces sp. KL116D]|uniref:MarR family winged helix-turn-helix transcriptional regulator n=1 Tax=Streptomyces sp. KL116D TaxID=3045152 RepID=UPI003556A6C3